MIEVVTNQTNLVVTGPNELTLLSVAAQGPAGPVGPSGAPVRFDVSSQATWIITHGLARVPIVEVYLASGEKILADVFSTTTTVTVTHSQSTAGFVILN